MVRPDVFFLQRLLYFIMNGTYLPLALTTTDNEIAGEAANLTDIEQDNIGGLLLAGGGYCFSGYIYGIQ
jgi:hypothetical protein